MNIAEKNAKKYTSIREVEIARILSNVNDPGRGGRAFELECALPGSKKSRVSAQGRVDVHLKMMVHGKVRYVPVECKTNGGRIDDLLNGTNGSPFVIYRLETVQKHKATKSTPEWIEPRVVPALVIPTALFLNMLRECNAIKEIAHHGVVDGLAIQPSSKKMYERLTAYAENYGLVFDNTVTYYDSDFEDISL